VTDDGYGEYETSLSGPDAQHFFIDGTSLFLQAGTPLNFEGQATYQVTVVASDTASVGESTSAQAAFTLSVVDVNEPPTQLNVTPLVDTLPELSWNDVTKYPVKVADVSVSDDALGTHPITLSGPDADAFELAEGYFYPPGLYLKAGTSLDFEVKPTLSVVLTAQDPALPDATPVDATFSLTLENVNEPPFDLRLTEVIDTIPEDSDTTGPIRLAKVG
ncbi:MAG: cadherin repeat domain-containing protein, partial [Deltaproteobacteria bacterium]|nr:cadherin repeat domain-containing protein [Deltaproteobacteria bacterium]